MTSPLSRIDRPIVLVGLMGAGKSTVGRRLARRLGLDFVDADEEIERAADRSIPEIFDDYGEEVFRDGERRVIARLIDGPARVIATGGGAFMDEVTRALILARCTAIWLDADPDILVERVGRRDHRPLLRGGEPKAVIEALAERRNPVYAEAHLHVVTGPVPHEAVVDRILEALAGLETGEVKRVEVALGARSYEVSIGEGALEAMPAAVRGRAFVVTDDNVWAAQGHRLAGLADQPIVVAPGEASKSWHTLAGVCEQLLARGIERGDTVVGFGGGMVGDLAGFAAAVVKRGCRFVQVPTTLLAQVDSAVGGKTAINAAAGKNMIGAFHQPAAVLIEPAMLATLPERELRAGYAEVVKYGLIGDAAFFAWCEANGGALLAGDARARLHAIETCIVAKAAIVAEDERETIGRRALLNLGHTFGHALEAETGFSDRLLHGEAVALGMALAFRFSAVRGLCPPADAERVARHLAALGLPVRLDFGTPAGLVGHMRADKKAAAGRVPFVLARGIGNAFVDHSVELGAVETFLASELG